MSTTAEPLWEPSAASVEGSELSRYTRWLEETKGLRFDDYEALWRWSTDRLEDFWASIWEYFDLGPAPDEVLPLREMPGAEWFVGTQVNYAEQVFRGAVDDEVAIRHAGELTDGLGELTWRELRELTARITAGLRARGVGRGDRVAAYIPNIPEAIAGFLACASIGAVWSSCSPDFGARSVIDRLAQIEPTVLIAVDGYRYGGRDFDRRAEIDAVRAEMPDSLRATVLLPYLDPGATLDGAVPWSEFIGEAGPLAFEPLPFDHPLWILYSSGTTGLPKAIVQGHGGMLIEQVKHHRLHLDAKAGDRVFWFTTTGWMMWNSVVGVLLTEASAVLFDGNPGHPTLDTLWDLVDEAGVTCFGTSAGFIAGCMKAGVRPAAHHDLSTLRSIGSTGSPLAPEGFAWVYEEVGADIWLFSTSGGTDVCTSFVGGVPTLPVFRGELQARHLGCAVHAFDEEGRDLVGEVGELVVTEPMPSMPLYLWNDPGGARYRDSYFDMYPGVWRHGDWVEITDRGTAIIYGRSDSTINRGGVRMGTSEIYRAVLALDEVTDALVLDVDGWMPLFVVLADGAELDEELEWALARRIRNDCSPRHVPNDVYRIDAVPRTISGKVVEVPIKRILQGTDPAKAVSRDSLADPEALDWFVGFRR